MMIAGVCCSPRADQATRVALDACLAAAVEAAPEANVEAIDLAELAVGPCICCYGCRDGLTCTQRDDFTEQIIPRLASPDLAGLIVATPVYFGTMSAQCKAFLDRSLVFRMNGFLWRDKVGGVVTVGGARNGGQELAAQAVHAAMLCQDMIIVGDGQPLSHYGGALHAWNGESAAHDKTGLETAANLGVRVALLARRLHS